MDKKRQRLFNLGLRLADILTWLAAIAGAYILRFYLLPHASQHSINLVYYLRAMPALVCGYMVLYQAGGLYDHFRRRTILADTG